MAEAARLGGELHPEHFRKETQAVFDRAVSAAIPPVLIALSGVYGILTVAHFVLLPPEYVAPLAGAAGGTAALFLAGLLALRRWKIPEGFDHAAGAIIATVALANTLVHLQFMAEARQTTNLLLIVIGTGLIFVEWS
ncbi:MAG: hypothetical protein EXR92_06720 [Gemmatimonadetes bacterium]|nr:hypothetical protein [Gemmatimonadota bacterium]